MYIRVCALPLYCRDKAKKYFEFFKKQPSRKRISMPRRQNSPRHSNAIKMSGFRADCIRAEDLRGCRKFN